MTIFRFAFAGAILPAVILSQPVWAQQIDPVDIYQDPHGIDLVSNNVGSAQMPELSIPAAPELAFRDLADFIPVIEVVTGDAATQYDPNIYTVSAGRLGSDVFALCPVETCYASNGTGGLLYNAEGANDPNDPPPMCEGPACPPYIYVPQSGDRIGWRGVVYRAGGSGLMMTFMIETGRQSGTTPSPVLKFLTPKVMVPGGPALAFEYESQWIGGIESHRPTVVTSTSGYQLRFTYFSDAADTLWGHLAKAEIVSVADPATVLASHTYFGNTVTDISGQVYECVCSPDIYSVRPQDRASRMKLPGDSNYTFETSRAMGSEVRTVKANGVTYTYTSTIDHYSWYGDDVSVSGGGFIGADRPIADLTITGPDGFYQFIDVTNLKATTGEFDPPRRRVESITDALGNTTQYQYSGAQRLIGVTYPQGNSVTMSYDVRGNLVARTDTPAPASSLQPISQTASYPTTSCGIIGFQCYKPHWIEDARQNRTEFTWSLEGLLLTQLDPPFANNRRKKTINTWSDSSAIAGETCPAMPDQFGLPGAAQCTPRLLTSEICETDGNGVELTCGTSEAIVTTYGYFEGTALVSSQAVSSGGETLLTCRSYDPAGRLISETAPRADLQVCS